MGNLLPVPIILFRIKNTAPVIPIFRSSLYAKFCASMVLPLSGRSSLMSLCLKPSKAWGSFRSAIAAAQTKHENSVHLITTRMRRRSMSTFNPGDTKYAVSYSKRQVVRFTPVGAAHKNKLISIRQGFKGVDPTTWGVQTQIISNSRRISNIIKVSKRV